jgi:hypothetical protein
MNSSYKLEKDSELFEIISEIEIHWQNYEWNNE